MNLYDAIQYRYSVRKYKPLLLSETHQNQIQNYVRELKPLTSGSQFHVELHDSSQSFDKVFSGITNGYFRVKAPHYLCFSSKGSSLEDYINIGYIGEQVSLYLTTLGIGSCWLGTPISRETYHEVSSEKDYHYVIMMAIGYPKNDLTPILSRKRLPLEKLVNKNYPATLNHVVDAFVASPSAINTQPLKLNLTPQVIDLRLRKGISVSRLITTKYQPIDLGIAICHIREALNESGINYDQHLISNTHCKWYLT